MQSRRTQRARARTWPAVWPSLVCAIVLGSCTSLAAIADAAPAAPAALTFAPCELRASRGPARAAAACARLPVPEDPAKPNGRQIELFVARIAALKPNPATDAVVLVNGGPGASSVDLYLDLAFAFAPLLLERDIILVDQRGTGRSASLDCPIDEPSMQQFDEQVVRTEAERCLAVLDADPRFYTTTVAVGDLEHTRLALGYRQWNLYGISYGTRVAQHYLQRYPASVRSLVLDGVVPLELALGPDIAPNAADALSALFGRCADDAACAARFPDAPAQFARLGARLRAAPVTVGLPDPVTGRPLSMELTYGHLAATVRMLSYAPETAALLPLLIDAAEREGNFVPLALHARQLEQELGRSINIAMHNSVVCSEDVPFYGDLSERWPTLAGTYLGTDQVRMLQTICAVWPRGAIDDALKRPLESATPALLLSGAYDPITPPTYAARVLAGLPNGIHLVAPGQGHGVIGRGCLPQLVADFVRSADGTNLDIDCIARLGADPFFLDLMGPTP